MVERKNSHGYDDMTIMYGFVYEIKKGLGYLVLNLDAGGGTVMK